MIHIPFIGLRFSNILGPGGYQEFPEVWPDAAARRWNLWGYIIAAADTAMGQPSAELLAEVYPEVTLTRDVGEFGTLLAIDRAHAAPGFTPQHSWRDHVDPRSP